MPTILKTVYASAPAAEVIIPTLEIIAGETIYACGGFEDQTLTLETGETITFEATGMDVQLPKRDNSGNQSLQFTIENVTGVAQRLIEDSVEAGENIKIVYRSYLSSDLTAPAEAPIVLDVEGAQFNGGSVDVRCIFQSPINTAWPKQRYTADFAPGLKYFI